MDRATAHAALERLRPRNSSGVRPQASTPGARRPGGVSSRPTYGLGLSGGDGPGDYKIAVRVQDPAYLESTALDALRAEVDDEVDVAFVGLLEPFSASSDDATARARPLASGSSISTVSQNAAGTLGAFVVADGQTYALSNNHVLAECGAAPIGTSIVQPGRLDRGRIGRDDVGSLDRLVPVLLDEANPCDAAIAHIGDEKYTAVIPGLGRPGTTPRIVDIGDPVAKRGRTTGVTRGTVTGISINLKVGWPGGAAEFVDLIEIRSQSTAFGDRGDSGSLIVAEPDLAPVGLLSAGQPSQDATGVRVYASPISVVLDELGVSLA